MNNKNLKIEIEKFKSDGKRYGVIKNWHQPTPTIDEFRDIVNIERNGVVHLNKDNTTKDIDFFLNECIKVYPNIKYDLYVIDSPSSRNSAPDNPGTTLHADPYPIIHWQCRGATLWRVGENAINKSKVPTGTGGYFWDSEWLSDPESFILEPGDVIWFENGIWHETENLTEKYSVVFDVTRGEKK